MELETAVERCEGLQEAGAAVTDDVGGRKGSESLRPGGERKRILELTGN